MGAHIPDGAGLDALFGDGLPRIAGTANPEGTARLGDDGHSLHGRWSFASGIRHCEWVLANVATGWHAIEFLLWGQDLSPVGPGSRPVEDYTVDANADRRAGYLLIVTDLLIDDLESLVGAWAPGLPTIGPSSARRAPSGGRRRCGGSA